MVHERQGNDLSLKKKLGFFNVIGVSRVVVVLCEKLENLFFFFRPPFVKLHFLTHLFSQNQVFPFER